MTQDGRGSVIGRDEMIAAIWQPMNVSSNAVDSVVSSFRKKLNGSGVRIVTVHRKSFYLTPDDQQAE